jgi:hypothetical protein
LPPKRPRIGLVKIDRPLPVAKNRPRPHPTQPAALPGYGGHSGRGSGWTQGGSRMFGSGSHFGGAKPSFAPSFVIFQGVRSVRLEPSTMTRETHQ